MRQVHWSDVNKSSVASPMKEETRKKMFVIAFDLPKTLPKGHFIWVDGYKATDAPSQTLDVAFSAGVMRVRDYWKG